MPDGAGMTDNERAAHLAELLERQLDHFKQTRDIEFKVNLAFWTAIVATGAFLYRDGLRITSACGVLLYLLIAVLVWLAHLLLWMVPIQYSEETDDHFVREYREQIEALCAFIPKQRQLGWFWSRFEQSRKCGLSWILAETWISLFVLFALGLVFARTYLFP